MSLSSIITQTDKNGVATKISAPVSIFHERMLILRKITLHSRLQVYDSNVSNSSNNSEANLKKPFFYRLFSCCMHHPKPIQNNSDANETEFSSTNPTLQREPLTRKPAKMPDIYSTTQPKSKKCLVLDLDETLVHSSFQVKL